MIEKTLGIIKPNSVQKRHIGKILRIVEDAGLEIVEMRMKILSVKEADGFYEEHCNKPFFGSLTKFMTSGPVVLFAMQADGAVARWRQLMGATDPAKAAPGTIRKLYADRMEANSVHGSADIESARREIAYFF